MEDLVGASQIEAGATRFQGENEDGGRRTLLLEALHHPITMLPWDAAMQEENLLPKSLLQVALEDRTHLRILGEDEGPVAGFDDLLQHLDQTTQLAGPPINGRVVAQEMRRMVAYLLEPAQSRQDEALTLNALSPV